MPTDTLATASVATALEHTDLTLMGFLQAWTKIVLFAWAGLALFFVVTCCVMLVVFAGPRWRSVGPWSYFTREGKERMAHEEAMLASQASSQARRNAPASATNLASTSGEYDASTTQVAVVQARRPVAPTGISDAEVRLTRDLQAMAAQQGKTLSGPEAQRMARDMLIESGLL